VVTTVSQTLNFQNAQTFNVGGLMDVQHLTQSTTLSSKTTTRSGLLVSEDLKILSYPFVLNYNQVPNPDGSVSILTTANQKLLSSDRKSFEGFEYFSDQSSDSVTSQDTQNYDTSLQFVGHTGASSQASYSSHDSLGNCYSRTLTSANNALTNVEDGQGCNNGHDHDH
jgi:hypothetical protein